MFVLQMQFLATIPPGLRQLAFYRTLIHPPRQLFLLVLYKKKPGLQQQPGFLRFYIERLNFGRLNVVHAASSFTGVFFLRSINALYPNNIIIATKSQIEA